MERERKPVSELTMFGEGRFHAPTPADLLTDPRVRALVEALRHAVRMLPSSATRTDARGALAPFEEVNRG